MNKNIHKCQLGKKKYSNKDNAIKTFQPFCQCPQPHQTNHLKCGSNITKHKKAPCSKLTLISTLSTTTMSFFFENFHIQKTHFSRIIVFIRLITTTQIWRKPSSYVSKCSFRKCQKWIHAEKKNEREEYQKD